MNNNEVNKLENKLITFKKRINEKNEKNENEIEEHSNEHLHEIHNLEKELLDFIQEMTTKVQMNGRWCSIAKTHFQEGCMALIRSTTEK